VYVAEGKEERGERGKWQIESGDWSESENVFFIAVSRDCMLKKQRGEEGDGGIAD